MHNNQNITGKERILNCFNEHFTSVGRMLVSNLRPTNVSYTSYLTTPCQVNFNFRTVDRRHVEEIIDHKIKNKSSTGHDGISTKLLKHLKEIISEPITFIINQAITSGSFPDSLKIARVKALFKKGNSLNPTNYRPISLLPAFSKVLEKIFLAQLLEHFDGNNLFFESQYGFRKKHSTELAIAELTDKVYSAMDRNEIPYSIFIDLSKAFDSLDHGILLEKLKYYGISGKSIELLSSYLTNRFQYTFFENEKSELSAISSGVPQGSILGPFLFLVYLNDFQKASQIFSMVNYADDTALFSTSVHL